MSTALKSFDRSALNAFLQSALRARNLPAATGYGKVQIAWLPQFIGKVMHFALNAPFYNRFGNSFTESSINIPSNYANGHFIPSGLPFLKVVYSEQNAYDGQEASIEYARKSGVVTSLQTPFIAGKPSYLQYARSAYTPGNLTVGPNSWDWDYVSGGLGQTQGQTIIGHCHVELQLPYGPQQAFEDLTNAMAVADIDAIPYASAGVKIIECTYPSAGFAQWSPIPAIQTFPQFSRIVNWMFQYLYPSTSSSAPHDHAYAGFQYFTDSKDTGASAQLRTALGASLGAQLEGSSPFLCKSRWLTSKTQVKILKVSFADDARFGSVFFDLTLANAPPNGIIPFSQPNGFANQVPNFLSTRQPQPQADITYNIFGPGAHVSSKFSDGELRLDYSPTLSHTVYLPLLYDDDVEAESVVAYEDFPLPGE